MGGRFTGERSWRTSFSNDSGTLIITMSGTLTRSDLDAMATEILALERNGTYTPPRIADMRWALNEHPRVTVTIFEDIVAARAWVESGGPVIEALPRSL